MQFSSLRSAMLAALGLTELVACGGESTGAEPATGGAGGNSGGAGGAGATGGAGGILVSGGAGGGSSGGTPNTGGRRELSCTGVTAGAAEMPADTNGIESCRDNVVHRPYEGGRCTSHLPRPADRTGCNSPDPNAAEPCTLDSECTALPNGECKRDPALFLDPVCGCRYDGCLEDSDCSSGEICRCGYPVGSCVPAACRVDSDCGERLACVLQQGSGLCTAYNTFSCQTRDDECLSNADCSEGVCNPTPDGRRCQHVTCPVPGRPFLVGGAARVASVQRRTDWCSSLSPSLEGLDAAACAVLAASWTEMALMEHASIAAFARFALELLSLGAPAAFIEATHAAIAEETAHARDAFALASAYGGVPVGPGSFGEAASSLGARTPEDIVRTAILEGCIGETVAAAEAAAALAAATDPAARAALSRVVTDETNHALLAWRFVQWVIEGNAAGLRDVAVTELLAAGAYSTEHGERAGEDRTPELAAHGVLSDSERASIQVQVVATVVLPCARALAASVNLPRRAAARPSGAEAPG